MDRRDFLRLSALGLLAPGCAVPPVDGAPLCVATDVDPGTIDQAVRTSFAAAAVPVDDDAFPQGVCAGAMRAHTVVLWVRVVGPRRNEPLVVRVWRDVDDSQVDLVSEAIAIPVADNDAVVGDSESSGIIKVRVRGLAAGTWYRYAVFVGDGVGDVVGDGAGFVARSTIGRVRTAFDAGNCGPVTIGATTCTNPRLAPFDALTQMADPDDDFGDLDAVLHLGDMVYADGSRSPDAYRAHWRAALADPGYRALLARQGLYLTWDDHEFDNNLNPEEAPVGLIEMAKTAFYENTPTESGSDGAWTSYQWGTTVEVIQLDARTERVPSLRGEDSAAYLSRPQMEFLKRRLRESPCQFKVVMNSVPMTRMPELWILQGDRWQGYEPAREEILNFLEDNAIDNVWFLSGDFHVGFVARLEQTGFRSKLWEVAVGPGGNLGNPIMAFVLGGQREDVFPAAQFRYGEGILAATRLRFDPDSDDVRIRFTGVDGAVLYDETLSRRS